MQDASRQLKQVRRRARVWLAGIHLFRFIAAMVLLVFLLVALDWALNLPGWLRLVIGLLVGAESVYWLVTRLMVAARFNPSLSELALRAERVYPQLAGVLASSVEFSSGVAGVQVLDGGGQGDALAGLAVRRTRDLIEGVNLSRLIDPSAAMKRLGVALLAVVALGAVVVSAPGMSRTAAGRWLMPLGSTQWPRSVLIEDMTGLDVWPVDAPVKLVSQISKGHRVGMRVNVHYRFTDALGRAGVWRRALLTEQSVDDDASSSASYEQLIEVPAGVVRSVKETSGGRGELSYYIQAGDGQTRAAKIRLVARPAVVSVDAEIEPPVYAAGLVGAQAVALHEQSGQVASASALVGSRVVLRVGFNKPVSVTAVDLVTVLPGLVDAVGMDRIHIERSSDSTDEAGDRLVVDFILAKTFTTPIHITDGFGLENLSRRTYRIEAIEDRLPSAAMTAPSADEAVLASAVVDVAATAQDDIGLERIELLGSIQTRGAGGEGVETALPGLAEQSGRQASLSAQAELDLSSLELRPGDAVVLSAVAYDVYEIDGRRHDRVVSTPRTLRIIDKPTLTAQLRTELAGLRQQVVRLEQTQQRIASEQPPSVTQPQQEQVTRRLDAQGLLLEGLKDRMDRNRLSDEPMREVIQQAQGLVDQASKSSSDAARNLRKADEQADDQPDQADQFEQEAHGDQQAVRQTLTELAELLDQGRDVLTLKLQLQQLKTQQQALANDTRELLPQTIGQDKDQLDEGQRQRLDELEKRQDELAEQAKALTRHMQVTAEALAQQGERDQDKAAAQALAEAAAIGQRQGLSESMQQSSGSMQKNQLSQSGQQQDKALDALDRMLKEMGTQERRRQAILRRRLAELSDLVRKLLERQITQASVLEQSVDGEVASFEPGQVTLRRATMGAQHQAGGSAEAANVAARLADAVGEQGSAVGSLRKGDGPAALMAERSAVDHLRSALEELNKLVEDNAAKEARKQREKLREAYQRHARRQYELRESVGLIVDDGPMNRQRRAALIGLAGEQSRLQEQIAETGREVGQTLVFEHMHERVGETSSRVVHSLRRGEGDDPVRPDQRTIAVTLRVMAQALKEDPNDDPFAGGDGGGGGGGGGGKPPPLVPPLAELKLIRGLQAVVYEQTRLMESDGAGAADGPMKQKMLELSTRQRELSSLGKRLIEKMKQQNKPAPMGGGQP